MIAGPLSEGRFDGDDVYWLEGRTQELGRLVVVRRKRSPCPFRNSYPDVLVM